MPAASQFQCPLIGCAPILRQGLTGKVDFDDPRAMGTRELPTRRQPKLAFHLILNFPEERTCLRPMPLLPTSFQS